MCGSEDACEDFSANAGLGSRAVRAAALLWPDAGEMLRAWQGQEDEP